MLSDKMQAVLNKQINMELGAYYTYLSMSAHFEDMGLRGFAGWMRHHAEEEMVHAMKIYDYVHRRRGKVVLDTITAPPTKWDTPLSAFEDAFAHERKVSIAIDNLVKLAREAGDNATESFLQWFVDEQVEEEEVVDEAIQKLKLIDNFTAGLYLLDRELAEGGGAHEAGGDAT
jgi:ferritin